MVVMNTATPTRHSAAPAADQSSCRVAARLGRFSSHPRWARFQLGFWYSMAAAPLVLGGILLVWYVKATPDTAVTFLVDYGRPLLLYGLSAAGFAIGMGLTAAVTAQARKCRRIIDDAGAPEWMLVASAVAMVVIAASMLAISLTLSLPPRARSLVACMGILPLVLIQSVMSMAIRTERADGGDAESGFSPWMALIPALPVVLVVATWFEPVSRWCATFPFVDRVMDLVSASGQPADAEPIRRWVVMALAALIAAPLVAAAFSFMGRLMSRVARHALRSRDSSRDVPLFPLLGETLPELPDDEKDPPATLTTAEQDPFQVVFFGGRVPYQATLDHVKTINASSQDSWKDFGGKALDSRASADVLIEGTPGSGRTTAVVAAVVQGVVFGGEHAVFLVPRHADSQPVVERLRESYGAVGMGTFLDAGTLASGDVDSWLRPKQTDDPMPVPAVLVGTLEEFETAFFGGKTSPDERRNALRRIRVMVVEDVDRWTFEDRLHLPFVLQKIRLFLAATGVTPRTLVVAPPLTPAGREIIRRQLFDDNMRRSGDATDETPGAPSTAGSLVALPMTASRPLFVQHYRSVALLLPRCHPIRRSMWEALGFPADASQGQTLTDEQDDAVPLGYLAVAVDPPLLQASRSRDGDLATTNPDVWPWAALANSEQDLPEVRSVAMDEPIDSAADLQLSETGDIVTPHVSPSSWRASRIAKAKYEASEPTDFDLAYATRLRPRIRGQEQMVTEIRQDDGVLMLDVRPFAASATHDRDRMHFQTPVLTLPDRKQCRPLSLDRGPCGNRLAMYALASSAESIRSTWRLSGLYDARGELGDPIQPPFSFSYAATAFVIIFDQPYERRSMDRAWDDVRSAWPSDDEDRRTSLIPELGAVVAAAMAATAPSLERLARCIGLRLGTAEDAVKRFAVLCVEPATTGESVQEFMREVLNDNISARLFLRNATALLANRQATDGSLAPFAAAGYAIGAGQENGRLTIQQDVTSRLEDLFRSLIPAGTREEETGNVAG